MAHHSINMPYELFLKLMSQVELTEDWKAEDGRHFPANVSGWDTHGGEALTDKEYKLLRALTNWRPSE
jgi:hypothetical protein